MFGMLRGIGLGAGLMYFFDPEAGRRRRAVVRNQFSEILGGLDEAAETGLRGGASRMQSYLSETGLADKVSLPLPAGGGANWASSTRMLTGTLGGMLLARCLRHPSALNLLAGTVGFGMLAAAITDTPATELLGGSSEAEPRSESPLILSSTGQNG